MIPNETQREFIHQTIYEELGHGIIREDTLKTFQTLLLDMKQQGAEAVILGCTEIGLLINESNSPLPVYDTALLHARAAAELALKE